MRVAVTGASGFVGSHVARHLAAAGHAVSAYGRRPAAALTVGLDDYTAWDLTRGPIATPRVDAVVHCAAHVDHWGPAERFRAVNVAGTGTVLDAFPAPARVVYVSSASVYDPAGLRVKLREDASAGGGSHTVYGQTKAAAEQLVLASGRPAVILRPHIVYGPGDTTLLPRLLAARRLGWLPVPGDGRNLLSVTHVFNLAHAVERALLSPRAQGAFNVADGLDASVDELLRTLLLRHGVEPRLVYVPRRLAWALAGLGEDLWTRLGRSTPPVLTRYVVTEVADEHTLDIERARRVLGYAPRWTYADGPVGDDSVRDAPQLAGHSHASADATPGR